MSSVTTTALQKIYIYKYKFSPHHPCLLDPVLFIVPPFKREVIFLCFHRRCHRGQADRDHKENDEQKDENNFGESFLNIKNVYFGMDKL